MSVLEINNIKKSFGKTEVLKGLSFSLNRGEVLSIIGSSGSGKTTLLRCLNFLEFADSGTIAINGETVFDGGNVKKLTDSEIRKNRLHFGLVFQSFNLFPQYNVLKNVMLAPTLLKRGTPEEIENKARALIDRVGLTEKLENYP
ncbi:MAG: ATP-binding cassette domain-containing protein, partial [Acutalibacteraceae bacterium]